MPARVQVIIEAKDAASGVMRGITSQFGQLGNVVQELTSKNVNWGNVAEQATTLVINGLKESYKAAEVYAGSIRDLSIISDTSAEETSRFVQVLDDFQLTAQDAETATRKLTQNGLAPTVETIADLADKYNSLNTAQEKNDFLIKNFGRAGLQWVNLLSQGSDEILKLNDSIDENLILTDQQVAQMEESRLALDTLSDTWQGIKIQTGAAIGSMIADTADYKDSLDFVRNGLNMSGNAARAMMHVIESAEGPLNSATNSYIAMAKAVRENATVTNEMTDAQISNITKFSMAGGYAKIFEGAAERSQELAAAQEDLRNKFDDNKFVAEQFKGAVKGLKDQLADGEITQWEYYNSVQALTAQWKDGTFAANMLSNASGQLADAQADVQSATRAAVAAMLYQQTAAALDAKGQLDLANKLGLISEKDYAIASALETLKGKYDSNADGMVSAAEGAEQYASDVQRLGQFLASLPSQVNTKVITEFVTIGGYTGPRRHGGEVGDERQLGGEVYAGNPYTRNERGGEPFVPSVNGRILGHAESLRALALGQGMSGGGSYNFYGNVTLSIGSDDASGLLSMR